MGSQKFIYFLKDCPHYPQEIFASSKKQVQSLLKESLGDTWQEQILSILTQEEFNIKRGIATKAQVPINQVDDNGQVDQYNGGTDFLQNMIKQATQAAKDQEKIQNFQNNPENGLMNPEGINNTPIINNAVVSPAYKVDNTPVEKVIQPPKFFEKAGIQFKLQNGKLYEKSWTTVKQGEFRIVNKSTKKVINNQKYQIQTLCWNQIQ